MTTKLQIADRGLQIGVLVGFAAIAGAVGATAQPQTVQDEYAVYELLAPDSGTFKTSYDVSVTTSGATEFLDRIGPGLAAVAAADDGVTDLMTAAPLKFEVLADALRIHLARPVPADGGQARLRIVKTYRDARSYRREGDQIVFERGIGIPRVAVVLPAAYQLTDCNVPSQVLAEPDGRIRASFMQQARGSVALTIKARGGAPAGAAARPRPLTATRSWEAPPSQGPTERARLAERARQDRDIVYFLQQPETNAFSLYHDYTESREGTQTYLNVVRTGSTVSNPSGRMLDTGEPLKVDVVTGAEMKAQNIDPGGEQVAPDQQVVVFRFPAVKKGQSVRLRMSETYTAKESYRLDGDELVFDRSFGRPRNSIVLPRGWYLTALSIPGTIRQTPEGLTRVDFVNPRPDAIDVLLKARRLARASQ